MSKTRKVMSTLTVGLGWIVALIILSPSTAQAEERLSASVELRLAYAPPALVEAPGALSPPESETAIHPAYQKLKHRIDQLLHGPGPALEIVRGGGATVGVRLPFP